MGIEKVAKHLFSSHDNTQTSTPYKATPQRHLSSKIEAYNELGAKSIGTFTPRTNCKFGHTLNIALFISENLLLFARILIIYL